MSLFVAPIQPPVAVFREEQRFDWWVYAAVSMLAALAWSQLFRETRILPVPDIIRGHRDVSLLIAVGLIFPLGLIVNFLRMTTVVTPVDVRLWFGLVPAHRRSIPAASIVRIEPAHFRPLTVFGRRWLRRGPDGEWVYFARGRQGVRLHLRDGSIILIGSQRPEELALAVEGAVRRGM